MIKKILTMLTAIAYLTIATANAGWLYLAPGFNYFGFRDRDGVLHAWQAECGALQPAHQGLSSADQRALAECRARRRQTD
jgi:hypothetical protein